MAATDRDEVRRQLIGALGTEHFTLQSARSTTVSESASRSSLYLTTVSSGVVALALVAQASRFGLAFFIFAFAILPVLFFLGIVSYGRLLQTGVEDVIYARAISRIRGFYRQIDPSEAAYFAEESLDFVGLREAGMFGLRWQQFLSAAAMVAIVNSVVGGVLVGLLVGYFSEAAVLLTTFVGGLAAIVCAAVFLAHQRMAWRRIGVSLTEVDSHRGRS